MRKESGDIKDVWSRFTTGVTVVTTTEIHDGPDGLGRVVDARPSQGRDAFQGSRHSAVHGMTANALCSVSVEPPLLLLSVGISRRSKRLIESKNRFGINFLNTAQLDVAIHFSKSDPVRDQPEGLDYWYTAFGIPMIRGSLAYIDCSVVQHFEVADHVIFIARAEHFELGQGEPLVYYEREYKRLDPGIVDGGSA